MPVGSQMSGESLLRKYGYAELRLEQSRESQITIKDEEVRHSSGTVEGMSVRVLIDGSWGFASCTSGRKTMEELLKTAEKLARAGAGKIRLTEPPATTKSIVDKAHDEDVEGQVKGLLEASRDMKGEKIASRTLSCTDSFVKKEFFSSQGASIIQENGYTYLSCSAIARSGDLIQRGSERAWSRGGFGKIDLFGTAGKSRDKALRLLDADAPPKGRFSVVLDPEMTGVLSHEALGHACEADSIIDRESILTDKLGAEIGNELVTIIDDPSADDFGHYAYDDEGAEGKPTTLIEKGVLRGFIDSMETANELNIPLNGHCRAQDYGEVPIVRMSNTYFQRGNSGVDEVFDMPSGIYLRGMKGGSVDIFAGGFMFKAEEAYEITRGEKGRIMRDVTISGNILQTLRDVECVGSDFGTSPGICGKNGQGVPVSDGGPHIRIKNVAIG